MARGLMQAINISPGQPVYVEDYRMQDQGLEWNVQNEFDYRIEYLMTNRVVMSEISSETLWGLTGWTPANSLKITILTGVLQCAIGMADIGGRRFVRTGAGAISPTGVTTDDVDYWIRAKYDTSADTHSFVAELASASPQADTDTDKRVTLATAHWLSPNWTGTPVDKRTSNTQLTPPAVISGDAGSNPVLSLHQEGSGLGLLVTGGDVSVGDATYNQQLIVYGTSTYGITIYDDPNGYSVEMIAGAANTLKVQTIGGAAATINVATLDAGSVSGLAISAGTINSGIWQGTAIANAYVAGLDQNCLQASSPTFVGLTLSGNIVTTGLVDGTDISVHVANNDAHHAQSHNLASHSDVTIDGATHEDLHAYGSANATWINCPLEAWTQIGAFQINTFGRLVNTDDTNGYVFYSVPLPANRGSKTLYINGTRVSLSDADTTNCVDETIIKGYSDIDVSNLDTDTTSKNAPDLWEDLSMGAVTCNAYHGIKIELVTQHSLANSLDIQVVAVRYYYA